MKKFLILILLVLFLGITFADVIPLDFYSDKEYFGENQIKYTRHGEPQYYLENQELTLIDSNWQGFLFEEWKYQVNKGLYSLGAKDNGTIGFRYKNKGLTLKLIGIGFYNSDTKQRIIKTGINLDNPVVNGNRITWGLPYDINYYVQYENKHFKDVLEMPQQIKTYLLDNRPEGWNAQNTWFGLIYDANGYNLNLQNFDSNKSIYFFDDQNKPLFFLPPKKVYHALHQSGIGDFNNEGREWQKKRIFYNGYYIEAIPVGALLSENGSLIWNADITLSVTNSTDDCDDTGITTECSDTGMILNQIMWGAGIIFREIPIENSVTINDANLVLTGSYSCVVGCDTDVFGINEDDTNTFVPSTDNPSDQPKTSDSTPFDVVGSFSPNAAFETFTINVKLQVQKIINRGGWAEDNNLGFVIDGDSFGRGESITITSYDHSSSPEPRFEITFEGPGPDPCEPDLDEDWVFVNTALVCEDKNIVTGTGNLFIDSNSSLTLLNSRMFLGSFMSCLLPPFDLNIFTFDGNMQSSSNYAGFPKVNASFPNAGHVFHSGSAWLSEESVDDHWILVDLNEEFFVHDVFFPIYTTFNPFSDINVVYFNSTGWHTAWEDNDFNMLDDTNSENCDWAGNIGTTQHRYCDKTIGINDNMQKIKIQVDGNSAWEGIVGDFNAIFGVDDIIIRSEEPVKRYVCLDLKESFFSVYLP